ncbi:serine kinase/phosphatase, partial [Pseudomonas syringae]
EEPGRIGDLIPEGELQHEIPDQRVREAGLTGASTDDHHSTDDDLSPETLIHEDGARSPNEPGEDVPADLDVTVVDEDDIGGGNGLDEEELAIVEPLDGNTQR